MAKFLPENPILGSKLGSLLVPFIKPFRFPDIGGLKAFVSEYFSDTLLWIGRTNGVEGDDIYRFIPTLGVSFTNQQQGLNDPKWCDVSSLTDNVFWRTFSNPNTPGRFSISPSKDTLYLCIDPSCQLSEGWKEICKITEEDYRQLAKDFTQLIPVAFQAEALMIINDIAFNKAWVKFLKDRLGINVIRQWESKRVSWVYSKFVNILEEAGCPEKAQFKLKSILVKSHHAIAQRTNKKDSSKIELQHKYRTSYSDSGSALGMDEIYELRNLMHKVVDRIGTDELRALRIPLGIILDVIRSH